MISVMYINNKYISNKRAIMALYRSIEYMYEGINNIYLTNEKHWSGVKI